MDNIRRFATLVLLMALAVVSLACGQPTAPRAAQAPSPKLAYIANVMNPTITIVDLAQLTVVDRIVFRHLEGKQQGHFLSVTPDGKHIWIAEDISPGGGFVQVIDSATGAQVQRWDVGAGVGNYLSRDGKYVFTTSTKTNSINVFDVANQKYLGDFPIGAAPHVMDSSPDGRTLWTTDAAGGNLLSFDISGLPERLPIPMDKIKIGGTLHALLVHPNGKYVFVGSDQFGDNVVDIATKSIVAKVAGKPHNYEISPDKKYLLSGETDYPTCDELKELKEAKDESKGPLLRSVNIATLDSPSPDLSKIKIEKRLDGNQLGSASPASISHHKYDPSGKYILMTTYRHSGTSPAQEGQLVVLNAATWAVEKILPMPTRAHAIAIPGHNR